MYIMPGNKKKTAKGKPKMMMGGTMTPGRAKALKQKAAGMKKGGMKSKGYAKGGMMKSKGYAKGGMGKKKKK